MNYQKLLNSNAFWFDLENTGFEVIRPSMKAGLKFLETTAQRVGVEVDQIGQETGKAMELIYDISMPDYAHYSPLILQAAAGEMSFDHATALEELDKIYAAAASASKDELTALMAAYDSTYKHLIIGTDAQSPSFLGHAFKLYKEEALGTPEVYEGFVELLEELRARNFPVVFVSSKENSRLAPNIKRLGLDPYADLLVSTADNKNLNRNDETWIYAPKLVDDGLAVPSIVFPDAGVIKKSPRGFKAIATLMNQKLEQVAMTGDSPADDISHILGLGGTAILARWGTIDDELGVFADHHWYHRNALIAARQAQPDLEFSSPGEMRETIRSLDLRGNEAHYSEVQERIKYAVNELADVAQSPKLFPAFAAQFALSQEHNPNKLVFWDVTDEEPHLVTQTSLAQEHLPLALILGDHDTTDTISRQHNPDDIRVVHILPDQDHETPRSAFQDQEYTRSCARQLVETIFMPSFVLPREAWLPEHSGGLTQEEIHNRIEQLEQHFSRINVFAQDEGNALREQIEAEIRQRLEVMSIEINALDNNKITQLMDCLKSMPLESDASYDQVQGFDQDPGL